MAGNLINLRRRIKSVKNTQKITKAMKTVSAAKLRRSVTDLNRSKPYSKALSAILFTVSQHMQDNAHLLLQTRSEGGDILLVIATDKGLCGSFTTHIIKRAEDELAERIKNGKKPELIVVGNKAVRYFNKHQTPQKKSFPGLMSRLTFQDAAAVSHTLQDIFVNEPVRSIDCISTRFLSTSRQEIALTPLFPLTADWKASTPAPQPAIDYLFEQQPAEIFQTLLPSYINALIYRLLLESAAAEHAARMIAMDLATRNASDMIRSLTLVMNKLRQASITNELLEIITATEALKQ